MDYSKPGNSPDAEAETTSCQQQNALPPLHCCVACRKVSELLTAILEDTSMDIKALLQPRVIDSEALSDFVDSLTDALPGIERNIFQLKQAPTDKVLIDTLFRALHNIKGDATLCRVDLAMIIAHPIEEMMVRIRNEELIFTDLVAEAILLAMDRLELAIEALTHGRETDNMKLPELVGGFENLALSDLKSADEKAIHLIEAVTGFRPASAPPVAAPAKASVVTPVSTAYAATATTHNLPTTSSDLRFFRTLALQYEARSPLFKGRIERLLKWALETNAIAGKPVDPVQLEAAVCMHDVGMMFLPESVWLKSGKLTDDEKRQLHEHPAWGADLLERMPGWQGAAEIVRHHQEMHDGGGYPAGLKGDQIVAGAKIMSIVDTFESVMLKHGQRGASRSLVRAIAEVNACDNQFAPEWIMHFNTVVRRMVES